MSPAKKKSTKKRGPRSTKSSTGSSLGTKKPRPTASEKAAAPNRAKPPTQDEVSRLLQALKSEALSVEERLTAGDLLIKAQGEHGERLPCPHGMAREDFDDQVWRMQKELLDARK